MTRLLRIRLISSILLAGALLPAATACGSSSGGSSSTPAAAASTPAAAPSSQASAGSTVNVTLKDFSITVASGSKLAPGSTTFHVTNEGPSAHNLTINGPGVSNSATPTFSPGTQNLTVTLQKGTYELFCSVPGHKQAGMDTHITVG
ncbi:MAG TPA: plastocyanin/azurin family copper-binding protein [Gaiellales bacterium]|nr:plastocyanin/azurin family copper-binding protein [Gaiellales bacterium]